MLPRDVKNPKRKRQYKHIKEQSSFRARHATGMTSRSRRHIPCYKRKRKSCGTRPNITVGHSFADGRCSASGIAHAPPQPAATSFRLFHDRTSPVGVALKPRLHEPTSALTLQIALGPCDDARLSACKDLRSKLLSMATAITKQHDITRRDLAEHASGRRTVTSRVVNRLTGAPEREAIPTRRCDR